MAFKMKGGPMARNYGAPFKKHVPGHKGTKVVDQGADQNDVIADAEYAEKSKESSYPGYGNANGVNS